jgi:hypothetical protein
MKTKLSLLLFLSFSLAACKKNAVDPNTSIKGTWELRATRNGNIMPATYSAGNGHLLSFGVTSFFEYASGTIVAQGSYKKSTESPFQYTISSVLNGPTASLSNSIYYTNEVIIQKDTLELFPANPDVATGFYIKTSNDPLNN